MTGYIFNRLASAVLVVLLVTLISFSVMLLVPGDPAAMVAGANATEAKLDHSPPASAKSAPLCPPTPRPHRAAISRARRWRAGSVEWRAPAVDRYVHAWKWMEHAGLGMRAAGEAMLSDRRVTDSDRSGALRCKMGWRIRMSRSRTRFRGRPTSRTCSSSSRTSGGVPCRPHDQRRRRQKRRLEAGPPRRRGQGTDCARGQDH